MASGNEDEAYKRLAASYGDAWSGRKPGQLPVDTGKVDVVVDQPSPTKDAAIAPAHLEIIGADTGQ